MAPESEVNPPPRRRQENQLLPDQAHQLAARMTAEKIFEARWAAALIGAALVRLRVGAAGYNDRISLALLGCHRASIGKQGYGDIDGHQLSHELPERNVKTQIYCSAAR